jgi:hypothetical protein
MVPLWLDGALEKAVKTDSRLRYDTFSEFFFDLTHPNPGFMKYNAPLLESNPTLFWKVISATLFTTNIICLYFFIS